MLGQAACAAAPLAESAGTVQLAAPSSAGFSGLVEAASKRRLNAGFLVVDGVYNTELTAPYDVLEHSVHHAPKGLGIDVFTVSPSGGTVTTAEGLRIQTDHGFADSPPIDILVVPSAAGSRDRDLENLEMIDWVDRTGREAGAVISLCWGAFVLARAGLLDDQACTTFPSDYDTFSNRFPGLDLRINVSFVHSGKFITSQGGVRSFEAAMHLIDRLYGESVATGVGGGLLIAWPPGPSSLPYLTMER